MSETNVLEFSDESLVEYIALHRGTELALTHRDHIKRFFELAGDTVPVSLAHRLFWSFKPNDDFVARARRGARPRPKLRLV